MNQSVAYYNKHAEQFMDDPLHVDMSALYDAFLPHLFENAHILDAGCGSGRDIREFLARDYRVTAFDASASNEVKANENTMAATLLM